MLDIRQMHPENLHFRNACGGGSCGWHGRRNVLLSVARNAARDMLKFSNEYGLTPFARTRVASGISGALSSKFDGLLA
jgi:phage terminase small subunit